MLKKYTLNLHENLEGLRDFVTLIDPFLEENQKKVNQKHNNAFKPFELARNKHLALTSEEKLRYEEELKSIFDGDIEVIVTEKDSKNSMINSDEEKVVKNIHHIKYRVKGDTSAFDEAFKDFGKTRFHKEQLYKNSLISLLSTVEWFFSQLLHFYYNKYPESAGIKGNTLTLEKLKSFEKIKDAEDFLIDNKIEEILRGSLKDWFKFLKEDFKLGLGYKDNFENDLLEIYQRRNLLVHNGGIVNSIYLSKISEDLKKTLKIGDKIEVTKEYLESAICKLELIFTLISCELWKKLDETDEERCIVLMEMAYRFLKSEQWNISECANYFLCGDKKMPVATRTAAQLNVWLCKKRVNGFESIKKELDTVDFSDKSLLFQVALSAIKDDKRFFFNNIHQVLKTEELKPEDLFDFPIFKEMRETDEFEKLKTENDIVLNFLTT